MSRCPFTSMPNDNPDRTDDRYGCNDDCALFIEGRGCSFKVLAEGAIHKRATLDRMVNVASYKATRPGPLNPRSRNEPNLEKCPDGHDKE